MGCNLLKFLNLFNPFERRKKDESIHHHGLFLGLKSFTFGALIILFILYLGYLIYKIITDIPITSTGYVIVNEMDVPDIEICTNSGNDLIILRCDFKWSDQSIKRIDNCSDYIIPETIDLGSHRNSCNTFKANKTIKYTNPNNPSKGLSQIGFYFNIPNISTEEATNIGIASLSIQLTSPDFNPLQHPEQVISTMDKAVLSNLQLQWNFIAGIAKYAAVVKFRTIAYKTILPNDVHAIVGLAPNYHVTPVIESDAHYFPFNSNPAGLPNGTTGYFSIAAGNFIQEQTTEQRSFTVFSALASAGGISGILLGIYAFLFGKSVKPYGHVHSLFEKTPENVIGSSRADNDFDFEKRLVVIEHYLHIGRERREEIKQY
ncbi:25960_t:CDS:2 [Gigaspora margarita]|uniref:25960_t:CDS:1 n=1 Tax=Gigaspora margarita TaxID=4874 RepID=A0ABN7VHH9_GIGMA|nr:25960_t:CDS:2 [Gigaspora margarita]